MANRTRKKEIRIRLNESELLALMQNFEKSKMVSRENYLRKLIANGRIYNIDFTELKEIRKVLANATKDINQVAKRVNETSHVYEIDFLELDHMVKVLIQEISKAIDHVFSVEKWSIIPVEESSNLQ